MMAVLLATALFAAGCSSSKKETEAPKAETEAKAAADTAGAAADAAVEAASEAADAAVEAASEAAGTAAEAVEAASEAADTAVEGVVEGMTEVELAAENAVEGMSEAADASVEGVVEGMTEVELAAENAVEGMSEAADASVEGVVEAMTEAEAAAEEAVEGMSEAADGAVGAAAAAVEGVAEAMTEAEDAVEAAAEDAAEAMTEAEAALEEAATETALEEMPEEEGTEAVAEGETEAAGAQIEELGERPEYDPLEYVVLGEYKNLSADVTKFEITDEDVEDELNIDYELQVDEKDLFEKAEEGTIADGDTVNIDYEGKIDGVAFDGGTGNYDLEIGSGSFIDGFEEQLVGVAVGETVDLNVTFPEDYGAEELAGKDAVFTVTANYIRKMPELTDELVSKMTDGEYTTIDAYREYEREKLTNDALESQKSEANNELMTQLYNTCEVASLPEDLVDYTMKQTKNQYIQMAQMYGMTYEDMIAMYGVDEETFLGYIRSDNEAALKQEIILKGIAATENITISEEEYQEGIAKYAEMYGMESPEAFEAYYPRKEIENVLLLNKTLDFVRENATINEVEPETETMDLDLAEAETELDAEEDEVVVEEDTEATT